MNHPIVDQFRQHFESQEPHGSRHHIIIPNFLSSEEVDDIVAKVQDSHSDYRADRGGNVFCTVSWFNQDQAGFEAVTEKIVAMVAQKNQEHFRLADLDPNFGQYQYVDYNSPGDAYGWHTDNSTGNDSLARRRLTVSIALTDSDEYEGGGFQLSDHWGHSNDPDPAGVYDSMQSLSEYETNLLGKKGSLIIFPSDRPHRALPVGSGTRKVLVCWISRQEQAAPVVSEPLTLLFSTIYNSYVSKYGEKHKRIDHELKNTEKLRDELDVLIERFDIQSLLDIPCGEFTWMTQVVKRGIEYRGADIVPELIARNKELFPSTQFDVMDITRSALPKADLIFVRDCFGHLSEKHIQASIENIQKSGSRYLLAGSFTKLSANYDIRDGGWRPVNLMIKPFSLKPQYLINEDCREGYPHYNDKCMILFDLENLY